MLAKDPKSMTKNKLISLHSYQFVKRIPNEKAARKYFEGIRWSKGRCCPHCKSKNTVEVWNERPQPYRCKDCRKHFSVRTGTALAASNVPLQKWLLAAELMHTAKNRISSYQMARDLSVTPKTAWMLCYKITEIWTATGRSFAEKKHSAKAQKGIKAKNKHYARRSHSRSS